MKVLTGKSRKCIEVCMKRVPGCELANVRSVVLLAFVSQEGPFFVDREPADDWGPSGGGDGGRGSL